MRRTYIWTVVCEYTQSWKHWAKTLTPTFCFGGDGVFSGVDALVCGAGERRMFHNWCDWWSILTWVCNDLDLSGRQSLETNGDYTCKGSRIPTIALAKAVQMHSNYGTTLTFKRTKTNKHWGKDNMAMVNRLKSLDGDPALSCAPHRGTLEWTLVGRKGYSHRISVPWWSKVYIWCLC